MRKFIFKKITPLAVVCAVMLASAGCSSENKFGVNAEGQYVDKKTDIAYIDAPACYEPIEIGDELYGKIGSAEIYEIVGAAPEKWLCESTGTVFYASDAVLPTLDEMELSYAAVTVDATELFKITDGDMISALVSSYCEGEAIRKPNYTDTMLNINWRLKFADTSVGIYYVLNYIELNEDYIVTGDGGEQINYGRKFIFNRFEDKCVAVGDVLSEYVDEYNALNQSNV